EPLVPGAQVPFQGARTPGGVDSAQQPSEHGTQLVGPEERSGDPSGSAGPSELELVEHRYASDSLKTTGTLRHGRREGTWTEYWENGAVMMTGDCEAGLRVGPWTWYYEDRSVKAEGSYVQGLKVGEWSSYHDNGLLLKRGHYQADEQSEWWKVYYRDGTLMEHGRYVRGVRQGHWEFFDKDGELGPRTGTYADGRLVRQ
ncbi:MAG: toxin-antitoxin system YwqK family antitoxin, partial [Planctomycetota bacterium]|nr:toxin-antitoxin system YwqK family antitoxin [Planctomycetota bacterium]